MPWKPKPSIYPFTVLRELNDLRIFVWLEIGVMGAADVQNLIVENRRNPGIALHIKLRSTLETFQKTKDRKYDAATAGSLTKGKTTWIFRDNYHPDDPDRPASATLATTFPGTTGSLTVTVTAQTRSHVKNTYTSDTPIQIYW